MGVVPVVDLSGPLPDVGAEIDAACRTVGFFQLVGHGLAHEVERAARDVARRFFALPSDAKRAVTIAPGDAYGYAPYLGERLARSRGDDTPPDLKETFSAGPFDDPPAGLDDPAATFVYSPNRWPVELPEMAGAWQRWYDAAGALVERLLRPMAVGLGLPADYFAPFVDHHTSAIRALHYPAVERADVVPGQLRAGAHSDYGTLTLLHQEPGEGGLQVLASDGRWHAVDPVEGAYIVNIGDAFERWTNGRWRSTLHRVVVTDPAPARRSMVFFHNANWDATIECLPTCLRPDAPAAPAPITAGRHLMERFLATQPDVGAPTSATAS